MPFYHDPTNTDTALEHSMNGEGLGSNTLVELTIFYPGKKLCDRGIAEKQT